MIKKKTKRKVMPMPEVGCVRSHFLDSGSFTLWTQAAKFAEENQSGIWDFYETEEFWKYMEDYVTFVKEYKYGIDLYANIDVIPNPELSYRNQKWLEKKGLNPVPVVHYTTDLKWLERYMREGYKIVALGGLVGSIAQQSCKNWIDDAFSIVCDQKSRLPKIKVHGFGVTSYRMLLKYPWYSVDSTSWTKVGAYGGILIPRKKNGKFTFHKKPYLMKVSIDSPETKKEFAHYTTMTEMEKILVKDWLDHIGIPLGEWDEETKEIKSFGVVTRHTERRAANLHFFEMLQKHIPEYPWPFKSKRNKGLGVL